MTAREEFSWIFPGARRHLLLLLLLLSSTAAAQETAGVWLGSAPICGAHQSSSCRKLDLLFDRLDSAGDGSTCWTGSKVFCRAKTLSKRLDSTDAGRLTIVSYNVFARPYLVSHDGQRERTCRIPRALLAEVPGADAIVFQEAFQPGCLADSSDTFSLRGLLRSYGFNYSTRTVGVRRWGLRINGGVFVASRWPILQQAQAVYLNAHPGSADSLANKGVVHAKIDKLGSAFHLFGTHLQAEDGPEFDAYREKQADELHRFAQSRQISPNEPVIFAGDFNADLLANRGHNDVVEPGITVRQWLDYVFVSREHKQPVSSSIRAVRLLADAPVNFCISAPFQPSYVAPDSSGCNARLRTRHLSDHFPVVGEFRFQ
uniref:sphingomyelin phosphodiesterase n=1 Tax=Macrostomum lignano TaxID=282301 RepID=A0A1I8FXG8_9PLAT